ncbi:MAG: hypothetical protein DWQ30_13180 [Acidobacteria bacterium]|nr:MAG: hypothetical protein DWQ30_13180 [Acidobacteriota bacterium]
MGEAAPEATLRSTLPIPPQPQQRRRHPRWRHDRQFAIAGAPRGSGEAPLLLLVAALLRQPSSADQPAQIRRDPMRWPELELRRDPMPQADPVRPVRPARPLRSVAPTAAAILILLVAVAASAPALQPTADASLHPVRVLERDAGAVDDLLAAAPLRLDYGAFEVALVADLAPWRNADVAATALGYELELGGRRFDPATDAATPSAALFPSWSNAAPGDRLHLLQFAAPIRAEWRRELEDAGLEVLRALHPFALIVWGDVAATRAPTAEAWLRHVGLFSPEFRLLPPLRSLGGEIADLRLLVVRSFDATTLRSSLESLGGEVGLRRTLDRSFAELGLRIPGNLLPRVAALPGVYAVHQVPTDGGLRGEMSAQVHAGNVSLATSLALPDYLGWLASVGVDGDGVLIANVDGGVNQSHADLVGRMVSCTGTTCSSTSSSHGTHTAGIMAADGASGVTVNTPHGTFLRGLGVAPGATMIEQVYLPFMNQPGGMLLLMADSQTNGAALSGNSWGPSGSPQGYDNQTMQVDIGVRDADPGTAGNQEFTYVLSFMNGNGGTSTQGTPDEAKNLINVGSTKMQTGSTTQITDIDDLSGNTAHGPALDGRTIPHIVAPGCSVDSTDTFGGGYGLKCGTSMASPHVSGTVALFVEQFRGLYGGVDPSPALIKAALLATARSLAGNLDANGGTLGHPFDSKQGWGRAAPAALLDPATEVAWIDQSHRFEGSGGVFERVFQVDDPAQPVRLMLVWTDAPGNGLGGSTPAWNNDLDLEVVDGADTLLGNVFGPDGFSTTGGTADDRNNTEGVFLDADPGRSAITVRVRATDVPDDGVPGVGSSTDQDFALFCVNCVGGLFTDGFEAGDTSSWSATTP